MTVEALTWITPAGASLSWPTQLLRGMSGRGLPPIEIVTRQVPQRAGAVRVAARHLERTVQIPLLLDGDVTTHRALLRTWAAALDCLDGPGTLRFDLVDGTQREISASFVGGLELEEQVGWMTLADATFRCHDPYWCDTSDTVVTVAGGAPVASFFPFFPLVLTSSSIAAETVIDNTGDVECWPIISVKGPASGPSVENVTTGDALTLSGSVLAGETVTLDARPGRKTVLRQDGVSLYSSLTSTEWFPLAKGSNRIRLSATGTTGATELTVRYRRRWLTV